MTYDKDGLPDIDEAKEFYAKYEPGHILGKGVSSTVRLVREKETGNQYAAKIIDVSCEQATQQQTNELKIATKNEINVLRACAEHKHIIELHHVFESSTFIFLIFELCTKGELFDYLTEVVAISEKRTRIIMRQLLEAIEFIHSKNIVHRDIKPENILLDKDLNVHLSDFGFATKLNGGAKLTDLCGTPGYLAPEVLVASMYEDAPGYGIEVDMWACGVIMYTMLVGFPPFWHKQQMRMLRNIMEGKYRFSSPEWDDISDAPKDLIFKLLVVDPTKRLTAKNALEHTFFKIETKEKIFNARKLFKASILAVKSLIRLINIHRHPPPISLTTVKRDPYSIKQLRKVIDTCAFHVYAHWVKRGEDQNRAALFEVVPKQDIKQTSQHDDLDSQSNNTQSENR